MSLKDDFLAALRAVGEPADLEQIHRQHRAEGGKHTYAALKATAEDLVAKRLVERAPPRGDTRRVYTLPHNAFQRMKGTA